MSGGCRTVPAWLISEGFLHLAEFPLKFPGRAFPHFPSNVFIHTLSATCANGNIPSLHHRTRGVAQQQSIGVPCFTSLIRFKATATHHDHQVQPPILVRDVPSPPVAVRARGFSPLT
jgi:hypothetical protein